MTSIRARFLAVSVLSVAIGLTIAAWLMAGLFQTNLERRADEELSAHLRMLVGSIGFAPDGTLERPDGPRDDRFFAAYGGLYWQIRDVASGREIRSRSLFDTALALPDDGHAPGVVHRYRLPGPDGRPVIVQERELLVPAGQDQSRAIRVAVAMDAGAIDAARTAFLTDLAPSIALIGVVLVALAFLQLMFGLRPVARMAADLDRVRNRAASRLPGPYPAELEPLARQLNRLLEAQDGTIDKARARAAELAHGLKTPLSAIVNTAHGLADRGEADAARELEQLADLMRAHVDRELARARLPQDPEARLSDAELQPLVEGILRTLKRTPEGEGLTFETTIATRASLPVDPSDCREMIGNLIENAVKWAETSVCVRAGTRADGKAFLTVEDDGPGVPEADIPTLTERFTRLDSDREGSGIGLAIVADIASHYGLALAFENRSEGGFRVTVSTDGRQQAA